MAQRNFERAAAQRELNEPLRMAILNRPGWDWTRHNGGYALYEAGKRRIAIVRGDITTGKYDAEKIGLPYNDPIEYDIADPAEIVRIVEEYF